VVAGRGFLRGERAAVVAVCLAELGVWGILAHSYAAGVPRALVQAGVLPRVIAVGGGPGRIGRGDEVEVVGLPQALVPGHSLAGRNLTRGTHLTLHHDLSAREIALLRVGGGAALATPWGSRDGGA